LKYSDYNTIVNGKFAAVNVIAWILIRIPPAILPDLNTTFNSGVLGRYINCGRLSIMNIIPMGTISIMSETTIIGLVSLFVAVALTITLVVMNEIFTN
jgi:hypothetical protein